MIDRSALLVDDYKLYYTSLAEYSLLLAQRRVGQLARVSTLFSANVKVDVQSLRPNMSIESTHFFIQDMMNSLLIQNECLGLILTVRSYNN